jgi:hypothetical protein
MSRRDPKATLDPADALQAPEGMVEDMPSEEFEAEARAIVERSVQEHNPKLAAAIARAKEAVARAKPAK